MGRFDLEITTFQMAVLFAWNQRPKDHISFESVQLATELPDAELRKTLFVSNLRFDVFITVEHFLLHCVFFTNAHDVFSCVILTSIV